MLDVYNPTFLAGISLQSKALSISIVANFKQKQVVINSAFNFDIVMHIPVIVLRVTVTHH